MPTAPGHGLILLDGGITETVDARDRGLAYGDGVFRTLRVSGGRPVWWREHLDKLAADCERLAIAPPDPADWHTDLEILAGHHAGVLPDGVLKLVVTRGYGRRGYAYTSTTRPRRLAWFDPEPRLDEPGTAGIAIRVCRLRLGHQPALAGVKHLNRLENVLARAEWNDPEIREGVLLDRNDQVVSGVMSNLFIWRDGCLSTPPLDLCGVAGVARARLMRLAAASGMKVRETPLCLSDVLDAEEVLFTNSLIRIWRAARLDARVWPDPVVSEHLREMLDG